MNKAVSGLEGLQTLEDDQSLKVAGWDSYGAKSLNPAVTGKVRGILEMLDSVGNSAQVVPTNTGGIQLEWNNGNSGVEVEFSPSESGIAAIIFQQVNGITQIEKTVSIDGIDVGEIRNLVTAIMPASAE